MSAIEILEELRRMPEAERRELFETIELEFGTADEGLSPDEIAELERRANDALAHPGRGTPIDEVSAEIRKRFLAVK